MVLDSCFQTTLNLPSLDLSKPLESLSVSSLSEACHQRGFFNIVNHGISRELFENIKYFSNQFFDLPSEAKIKLGPSSSIKSYTPHFIASPYFESFRVSGPDFHSSAQDSLDVVFGSNNRHEFREILDEYGKKMTELAKKIMKIALMVLGDGFDTRFYDSDFKNCHGYLRINRYSFPTNLEDKKTIEGLGIHTDMSCITIVYQDEIGGLQVKSKQDGRWMDIVPNEGTLVVNIGDLLQAWSNDKLVSSEHRVVLKEPAVNRFSIAFFWCFEDEKVILAPIEVTGNENMRLYKPFVCLDYLKFRESNEEGKFEKVGFTVKDFVADHNTKNGIQKSMPYTKDRSTQIYHN